MRGLEAAIPPEPMRDSGFHYRGKINNTGAGHRCRATQGCSHHPALSAGTALGLADRLTVIASATARIASAVELLSIKENVWMPSLTLHPIHDGSWVGLCLRFQSVDKTGNNGWVWRVTIEGKIRSCRGRSRTIQRNGNSCMHQATSLGENSKTWRASILAQLPKTSFASCTWHQGAI